MRSISLFFFLCLLHAAFCASSIKTNQPFVEQWCTKYISSREHLSTVETQEIQVLLNLFYLAYKRSSCVIELQDTALEVLDLLWISWQQIIQLRLNPGYSSSHPTDVFTMGESIDRFSNQLHEFETVSNQFSECITYITSNELLSDEALKALQEIQKQEQVMIAESIGTIKPHIDELLSQLTQTEDSSQHLITKGGSIVDFIWSCLPHLAINSFTETDQLITELSKEQWNVVKALQQITNMNWNIIEQARSDFYYLLYKRTYQTVQEQGIDPQYLKTLFEHSKQLPIPTDLD